MGDDSTKERTGWGWFCIPRTQSKSACEPDVGTEAEDDEHDPPVNVDAGMENVSSQHETVDGPMDQREATLQTAAQQHSKHYWRSAVDPVRGITYYYHKKTKAVIWEKPIEMEDTEYDGISTIDPVSGDNYQCNTKTQSTSWEEKSTGGQPMDQEMDQKGAPPLNAARQETKNYWRTAVDPVRGIPYYYHKKTKETRWEKPVKLQSSKE